MTTYDIDGYLKRIKEVQYNISLEKNKNQNSEVWLWNLFHGIHIKNNKITYWIELTPAILEEICLRLIKKNNELNKKYEKIKKPVEFCWSDGADITNQNFYKYKIPYEDWIEINDKNYLEYLSKNYNLLLFNLKTIEKSLDKVIEWQQVKETKKSNNYNYNYNLQQTDDNYYNYFKSLFNQNKNLYYNNTSQTCTYSYDNENVNKTCANCAHHYDGKCLVSRNVRNIFIKDKQSPCMEFKEFTYV